MSILKTIAGIPEKEKTPLVVNLIEIITEKQETIQILKDEIARLKSNNKKPNVPSSNLEKSDGEKEKKESGKRPGSHKRKKTESIRIHKTEVIEPESVPAGSVFKGYQEYTVQDLKVEPFNTLYRLKRYEGPNGEYIVGKLPENVDGHYGVELRAFILYHYYNNHVTPPLIFEQQAELGVRYNQRKKKRNRFRKQRTVPREKERSAASRAQIGDARQR